jgi:hypothetical protein
MAYPSVTYTFTNGTTASATEVNQNFSDLISGLSAGTKDISIAALTVAGAASFNGTVTLGNATGDDITVTGYVASAIIPKTDDTYDLGTAALAWQDAYFDGAVYTDTISELTGAAGVTIDSFKAKDGGFTATHSTHTMVSSGAANSIYTEFGYQGGTTERAQIGLACDTNGMITGATLGDLCLLARNDDVLISGNDGASIGLQVTGGNAVYLGPAAGGITHVFYGGHYTSTVTTATANTSFTATFSNTNYYNVDTNGSITITCQNIGSGFTGWITVRSTAVGAVTITLSQTDAYVQATSFALAAGKYAVITVVDTGRASVFVTYVTDLA